MDYANYNISNDISNQPEDARSMALLANVLIEKVKRASHSDHHQHHELKEALSLANTSIKLSPTESIGCAVLSTITLLIFEQRMIYLRKAVDIEQQTVKRYPNNISSRVAIITSLVRLLLEPREEMARNKEKTTAKHIMRQNLGINSLTRLNEQSIYEELKLMLDDTKTTIWNKREERWKDITKKRMVEKGQHYSHQYQILFSAWQKHTIDSGLCLEQCNLLLLIVQNRHITFVRCLIFSIHHTCILLSNCSHILLSCIVW